MERGERAGARRESGRSARPTALRCPVASQADGLGNGGDFGWRDASSTQRRGGAEKRQIFIPGIALRLGASAVRLVGRE